jgi:hypothetical protein
MTSSVPGSTAEELIQVLWAQTRPPSPAWTQGVSIALAELIRYLIYATGAERRAAALPKPADGYGVAKNLRAAADAGQPLCTALADWAEGLAYGSNLRQVREAFDEAEFPAGPGPRDRPCDTHTCTPQNYLVAWRRRWTLWRRSTTNIEHARPGNLMARGTVHLAVAIVIPAPASVRARRPAQCGEAHARGPAGKPGALHWAGARSVRAAAADSC